MLNLCIYKKSEYLISFNYMLNDEFFSHEMSFDFCCEALDNELFRIAILSNPFYDFKRMIVHGVKVSKKLAEFFEKILSINIEYEENEIDFNYQNLNCIDEKQNIILGFSGGFDSLAARALLPKSKLMSIDFGGNFSREGKFFRKFNTNIVKWDLRLPRLNLHSRFNESLNWRFMLSPAYLMTMHNAQCTMHNAQCTMHNAQ